MQINTHDTEPSLVANDSQDVAGTPASCAHNPYLPVVFSERGCGRTGASQAVSTQPEVLVLATRSLRAWPNSERGRGRLLPLVEALTTPFATDAHFVQYSVPSHPYRLLCTAYEKLSSPAQVRLFVADVDSLEAHKKRIPATDGWFEEESCKLARLLGDMPGAYVYRTTGGYRLVYTLTPAFDIGTEDDAIAWKQFYVRSLIHLAREYSIVADASCKPWNWLFRLPRATRNVLRGPETPYTLGDPSVVGAWSYVPS